MAFDVQGARRAGYTDAEIAGHLARERNFDIDGARRAGYGDSEIVAHLTGQQSGSWLGRRARDLIEGVAAPVSAAAEAMSPGPAIARQMMRQQAQESGRPTQALPTLQDLAGAGADALGLPRAVTPEERLTSAAFQGLFGSLPTMGLGLASAPASAARSVLFSNPVSQLAAGAAGGVAGEAAQQAGAGPVGSLGAAVAAGMGTAALGGALRGAGRYSSGVVEPFSQSGREGIAADILLRSSSDPQNLLARIGRGMGDPDARLPNSPPTTGTVARDPGLMVLEQGLRSRSDMSAPIGARSPAAALRDLEAQRNAARDAALAQMAGNSTPEARGAVVREALRGADDAMGARVNMAFNIARDRNTARYSAQPVLEQAQEATRVYQGLGGGVPAELQGVIDDLTRAGSMTLSDAQAVRERLGSIAGQAQMAGDQRLARAAGAISESLEQTVNDPRWMQAVALRREQGQMMGRNEQGVAATGAVLRPAEFGMPAIDDPAVMRQVLASPLAVRQTLEAGYRALDDARRARLPVEQIEQLSQQVRGMRTAMREQFVQNALEAARTAGQAADSAGNVTTLLSPAQFQRFMRQNSRVIPELFEPGQAQQLTRLVNDFAETSLAMTAANARGSPTVQNMSVGNLIARASNGLLDPGTPIFQSVNAMLRPVFAASENAVQAILTQAVTDPQFARLLLQRASPQALQRAQAYIEQNFAGRLAGVAGTAALRQSVRTANEQERQQ